MMISGIHSPPRYLTVVKKGNTRAICVSDCCIFQGGSKARFMCCRARNAVLSTQKRTHYSREIPCETKNRTPPPPRNRNCPGSQLVFNYIKQSADNETCTVKILEHGNHW